MLCVIIAVKSKLRYSLVNRDNTIFIIWLNKFVNFVSYYDDLPQNVMYLVKFVRSI